MNSYLEMTVVSKNRNLASVMELYLLLLIKWERSFEMNLFEVVSQFYFPLKPPEFDDFNPLIDECPS